MSKDDSKKVIGYLQEFEENNELYNNFVNSIKSILKLLLKSKEIKYQLISKRVKDLDSLEKKLKKYPQLLKNPLREIIDLAGCRVIFYLENEIKQFIEIIKKEFNVIDIRDKYDPEGYNAIHVIVKIDDKRLELPEYENFKDLICEIQLTTVLFHAWSEISHDIVYKKEDELVKFSEKDIQFIDKKLKEIMSNYLQKANNSFSFISNLYEMLKEGKEILNIDKLKEMKNENSNSIIFNYLNKLNSFTGYYQLPEEFNFLDEIELIIQKSIENDSSNPEKIKTSDVSRSIFNILDKLFYWDFENIIMFCINNIQNEKYISESFEILIKHSEYDLNIVSKIGYLPQMNLINKLKGKFDNFTDFDLEIITICKNLLNNSIEGNFQEAYNKYGFKVGSIFVNDNIKEIRNVAIKLLLSILSKGNLSLEKKEKIITALFETGIPIKMGQSNEDLENLIKENLNKIISYFLENYDSLDNYSKREIEKHFLRNFIKEKLDDQDSFKKLKEKLTLNDKSYLKFKNFIGYDLDYGSDFKGTETKRINNINNYINEINSNNIEDWISYIKSLIVEIEPKFQGIYENLNYFLYQLSVTKPDLGKKCLQVLDESQFKISVYRGLLNSSKKDEINFNILEKIEKKEDLFELSAAYYSADETNQEILEKLVEKIISLNNVNSLIVLLETIAKLYSKKKDSYLKKLFLDIVRKLTELKICDWTFRVGYIGEDLFNNLNEEEFNIINENLILKKDIDYDVEKILESYVKRFPSNFIDFLYKRVQNAVDVNLLDAIPYSFQVLREPLKENTEKIFIKIYDWLGDDWKFNWEAGHLFNIIYPTIEGKFKDKLVEKIRTASKREDLNKILFILDKYKGTEDVLEIVKEIIIRFKLDDKLKNDLISILRHTRVVTGEYGLVNAYKEKIDMVKPWLKEENKKLVKFGKEFTKYLENSIKFETARVEKELENMKSRFERDST